MKTIFTTIALAFTSSVVIAGPLDAIATLDILGSQRAYIESKLGPAQKVFGNERLYQWKQCRLTISEEKKVVTGVRIEPIGKGCDFDTSRIGLSGKASELTFGRFARQNMAHAEEACLTGCGNAAEPEYGAYAEGAHYQQFTRYEITTSYGKSEHVLDGFKAKLKKKIHINDDFELYGDYLGSKISQDDYDQLFFSAFKNIPVTSIRFAR